MIEAVRRALSNHEPKRIERDGLPRAAVLIALYEKDDAHHILFQVRSEMVEHHKGQISFPGGAEDPGDADLVMTALRETEEEIGVQREDVEVLGQLDDIVTISNFIVTPFAGAITRPGQYPFAPSGYEVAELLEIPVPHLLHPETFNTGPAPWRDRQVPPPSYSYGEHVIWGATGRVLQRFFEITTGE